MSKLQLMKAHALVAAFTLPVAAMFLITGALYTWGVKGSYTNEVYELELDQPITSELKVLTELAQSELIQRNIEWPSGTPKLKTVSSHFFLEWTGSSRDVILEPADRPLAAKLTVKETSWYRNFVQLHKAKGGSVFKVYAALFASALAFLLISGFVMAWQTPRLKPVTLITSLLGVASFCLVVWLS